MAASAFCRALGSMVGETSLTTSGTLSLGGGEAFFPECVAQAKPPKNKHETTTTSAIGRALCSAMAGRTHSFAPGSRTVDLCEKKMSPSVYNRPLAAARNTRFASAPVRMLP
jgi:hypothetical protein